MNKNRGNGSIVFSKPINIIGTGSIAGHKEAEGPLAKYFDKTTQDALYGQDSFEKAERQLFLEAVKMALKSANLKETDFLVGGDLLNQIISAGFASRELGLPFIGIYGACSTMAESLILGSILVDGGFARDVVCATSSHFATAERQFRFPLELGTPPTPTSQHTVTGSGSAVLSNVDSGIGITCATIGKIVDLGITDANNMGAAMAPAAAQTILTHIQNMAIPPNYYDAIFTGDLGSLGSEILIDLAKKCGTDISDVHQDCGVLIFSGMEEMKCGGSGCGCGASTLCGYIIKEMQKGNFKRILFVATGALHSPTSIQQGESIPGIAHAVEITKE